MSIVRFRSAVREHEELAFLFVAIAMGLCLGADQRILALIGFSVITVVLVLRHFFTPRTEQENLFLKVKGATTSEKTLQQISDILSDCCTSVKLKRYDLLNETFESSFLVAFRHLSDLTTAQERLQNEVAPTLVSVMDSEGLV